MNPDTAQSMVDAAFERELEFTANLIRDPSISRSEGAIQDRIAQEMSDRGMTIDRWRIDEEDIENRPGFGPMSVPYDEVFNVVGTHQPATGGGRSLILQGHVDDVPTGTEESWSHPPFEPRVEDGQALRARRRGYESGACRRLLRPRRDRRCWFLSCRPDPFPVGGGRGEHRQRCTLGAVCEAMARMQSWYRNPKRMLWCERPSVSSGSRPGSKAD